MINKNMKIGEVIAMDRGSAAIFFQFGMHCIGCPHSIGETLEEAGMVHGIDVDALVVALNKYFDEQKA